MFFQLSAEVGRFVEEAPDVENITGCFLAEVPFMKGSFRSGSRVGKNAACPQAELVLK